MTNAEKKKIEKVVKEAENKPYPLFQFGTQVVYPKEMIVNFKQEDKEMNNTVTQQQIDEIIANGTIEVMKLGEKTTLVKFTSKEGFEIVETSACVDKANFDMEIGKEICLERIKNKLWAYEGYCLQKELYKAKEKDND